MNSPPLTMFTVLSLLLLIGAHSATARELKSTFLLYFIVFGRFEVKKSNRLRWIRKQWKTKPRLNSAIKQRVSCLVHIMNFIISYLVFHDVSHVSCWFIKKLWRNHRFSLLIWIKTVIYVNIYILTSFKLFMIHLPATQTPQLFI